LNAVSSFLKKSTIKSTTTGVIESIDINLGDNVETGQLLVTIKTKEASALEKSTYSDTTFNFKGLIKIKSTKDGIISSISHHKGDYVQEGDELAIISEQSSLVFLLEVPFELRDYIKKGATCDIMLPDNRVIQGIISSKLPVMDMQSQTENYIIKPVNDVKLPENLIVKIKIVKNAKQNAIVLLKPAVLTNETQTDYWVMKLLNDSIAIKVSITKGIENSDKIEILSPAFNKPDRILLTGNYGLADTAKVVIQKQ
jgi:multidrug resistance efflux pump